MTASSDSNRLPAASGFRYAMTLRISGVLQWETTSDRWVGNGRTVLNNKGLPVKQYEPFFSSTEEYVDEVALVEWGVTPVWSYDPMGRSVLTTLPGGHSRSVDFDAWKVSSSVRVGTSMGRHAGSTTSTGSIPTGR